MSIGSRIPKSKRACVGCSDSDYEYIQYLYQLYLMIEDEDGKQVMVSINDEVSFFFKAIASETHILTSVHYLKDWNVYSSPTTRKL